MNTKLELPRRDFMDEVFNRPPPACNVMDLLRQCAQATNTFFHIECDPRFPQKPWRIHFKLRHHYHTVEAETFADLTNQIIRIFSHHNRTITIETAWQPEAEYSI